MDNLKHHTKAIDSNLLLLMLFATVLFLASNAFIAFAVSQANRQTAKPYVCEVYLHTKPDETHVYQGVKK
jgi:hypothetical protein